ncbi:MAG: hypothetical protein Q4G62_07190 [Pseudomonadota bacterium]|nr:hypothetical protein [Pseudomonadota bacterium]
MSENKSTIYTLEIKGRRWEIAALLVCAVYGAASGIVDGTNLLLWMLGQ